MSVPWYLMAKGKGGGGYKTASGPIVSVNDALAAPLRSLLVSIDPVQDLHGYDNPWPAGGGEQLIPFPYQDDSKTSGNITFTVSDNGAIHISGTSNPSTTYFNLYGSTNTPIPDWMTPNTQYYFSPATVTGKYFCQVIFYGSQSKTFNGGASFTSPADFSTYTGFAIVIGIYSTAGDLNYDLKVMLKKGSSASPWQPYSNICPISGWSAVNVWVKPTYDPAANPTVTIQLGQTVYGGTLDVTIGVLTVDRAMVDLGDINWNVDTNRPGVFYGSISRRLSASSISMCSEYEVYNAYVTTSKDAYISGRASYGANSIFVRDTRYATLTGAEYKVASAGITAVYELATPITIPLTPQEISTLQGQNNVWADTGDVDVEYLSSGGADPDLMKLAVAFMGRK